MIDDQIQIAQGLHGIKEVYIIEHQNCGAYSKFLDSRNKKADFSTVTPEEKCHKLFSGELAQRIVKDYKLNAHCFFIDLRGNVKLLNTFMA